MNNEIELTQGKVALVDDEDYEWLNQWKWYCSSTGYAARDIPCKSNKRKRKTILMHRIILETPPGVDTDHINRDRLDNRSCNLRICTRSQNEANKGLRKDNTSGIKGIHWDKQNNKWHAEIKLNGEEIHIGYFRDIGEAALAYKMKAQELFGEFAIEKIGNPQSDDESKYWEG